MSREDLVKIVLTQQKLIEKLQQELEKLKERQPSNSKTSSGVPELQYESMMDNKVTFYEMPWMQLNSYPQKWNPEREALIIFVSIAVGNFFTNMQSIEVIVMMWDRNA